jgi:YD repeat-containing protein
MSGMYAFDWGSLGGGNYEFQYVALDGNGQILNQQSGTFNTSNPNAPSVSAQTPLAIGGPGRAFVSNSGINGMGSGLQLINQGADAASVEMRYRLKNSNGDWLTPGTSFAANNSFGIGSFVLDPAGLSGMVNGNQYDVQFIIKNSSGTVLRTATGTITKDTSGLNISPLQVAPKLTFTQPTTAKTLDIRYRLVNTGTYSLPIRLTTIGNGQFEWDPTSLISNFSNTYDYDFDIQAQDADGMLVNHNQVNVRLGATTSQLSSQIIALPQVLRIKPTQTGINYMQLSYRVKGSSTDYSFLNNKVTASTNDDGSKEYRFELPATLTAGDYEYRYTAYAADTVDANGDPVQTALGSSTGYFTAGTTGRASRLDWVIATNGNVNSPSPKISRSQSYNAFGDIVTETDGRGNVTSYTYNTLGAMTKKVAPKVSITAENGAVNANATPTTEYTYDALGRVIAVKDANGNLNTQVWRAGSTEEGNITLEKHADGGIKAAGFDIFGNKRTEYDELATSRTTSAADATHRTDYTYDKENRLTKVEHQARNADGSGRSVDQYSYDAVGNRISHTNADNNTEKTTYDSLGRVTKTTSFMGFDTSYAYTYLNNLTGVGGATVGGWQKVTIDTVGRTLTDKLDMFNHLTWHEDLGGHQFTYSYNQAGWLMSQTGTSGQNIAYSYYNNGYIQSIQDKAVGMYTYYQYDDDGNKTFEGYISLKDAQNFAAGAKDYYQYATITYDAMNRMTSVVDPKAAISYEYDAVGNRRMVHSEYYDGANGSRQIQEYWYKYDSMNRFLITMGALNGARSGTSTSITRSTTGVDITYNATGQRTQAINGSDNTTEGYSYTNDGYLTDVKINGTLSSQRTNDALGRVTTYQQFGSNASTKNTTYDKDNRVTQETGTDGTTNYYYYTDKNDEAATANAAGKGGLARVENKKDNTTVNTYYAYQYWDDAKQFAITNQGYNPTLKGNNNFWKPGYSELKYDVNGHLVGANDAGNDGIRGTADDRTFRYVNDAQGLILFRDEIAGGTINRVQRYYYVDGKRIGDVGNDGDVRTDYVQAMAKRSQSKPDYKNWKPVSSADFDQNYEPISPSYPGFAASTYTVKNGDTLQSIARSVWGDGDMWYLIADANGLTNSNSLTAGQVLTIPNKVTNIHNNSGTYRVYNPGEAIGDVNPTLPTAPPVPRKKKGGCGGFASILVAVVTLAVTVIATASLGPIGGAAVGNLAGQVTGNVLGVQKGFDFKSFATSVATAGITEGLIGGTPLAEGGKTMGLFGSKLAETFTSTAGLVAARAVVGNVVGQGIGNLTGLQKGFSWSSVAAAGVGAAAGAFIGDKVGNALKTGDGLSKADSFITAASQGVASSVVSQLTQIALDGKGKLSWANVAINGVSAGVGALAGYYNPKDGGRLAKADSVFTGQQINVAGDNTDLQLEKIAVTAKWTDPVKQLIDDTADQLMRFSSGQQFVDYAAEKVRTSTGSNLAGFATYTVGNSIRNILNAPRMATEALKYGYTRAGQIGSAVYQDPLNAGVGIGKSILNFGPEAFNGATNLTKMSLNGLSYGLDAFGSDAGKTFRATNAYNLPTQQYNGDAQLGGAIGVGVLSAIGPDAVSKLDAFVSKNLSETLSFGEIRDTFDAFPLEKRIPNLIAGEKRENLVLSELKAKYPNATIQKQVYLRNADNKIAKDPLSNNEGRRLDFVVIQEGKVLEAVEVTSMKADKAFQLTKEDNIRSSGGTFIRDRSTGQLIDISNVKTFLDRRN